MKKAFPESLRAFTLVEVLIAGLAAAVLLTALYGVFGRSMRLRDQAVDRTTEMAARQQAVNLLREDLANGLVSGGVLAEGMAGGRESTTTRFPGFLRLTTTTGRNSEEERLGDVQQVAYYVVPDPNRNDSGFLVRAVDRVLLAPLREPQREEVLLQRVSQLEVRFYDGSAWVEPWEVFELDLPLPEGVSVTIHRSRPESGGRELAPIQIYIPWPTRPALSLDGEPLGVSVSQWKEGLS